MELVAAWIREHDQAVVRILCFAKIRFIGLGISPALLPFSFDRWCVVPFHTMIVDRLKKLRKLRTLKETKESLASFKSLASFQLQSGLMAQVPMVAIIGRPNTGKSTLYNRLIGRQHAIVTETPGTTRDHVAGMIEGEAVDYLLVDTGGMGGGTEDTDLEGDIEKQSRLALANADLILFTVSSRDDITSSDLAVADILRREKRRHVPVLIVITMCDNPAATDEILPTFYELGIGDRLLPVSAPHNLGIDDLKAAIEEALQALHFGKTTEPPQDAITVALLGRPNVGKSSIINALMSDTQRAAAPRLTSETAGTTRDAVDTTIQHEGKTYVFTDTAGLRHGAQPDNDIEVYAEFRALRALERSDIAVLALDATQPVSRQDKRIADLVADSGKGLILLLNKIDLVPTSEREAVTKEARAALAFCRFAPILAGSATTRQGLLKLFPLLETVAQNRTRRIVTQDLHRWFLDVAQGQPLGQLAQSKHITQAEELPPTFVVFVRDPKRVPVSQLRYLERRLRETFAFEGTPVRWITKRG